MRLFVDLTNQFGQRHLRQRSLEALPGLRKNLPESCEQQAAECPLRNAQEPSGSPNAPLYKKCNTQSFPVVCDSPSPGTSWRNRENPAPLRAHVSATIGREPVATLVKVRRMRLCAFSELGRETHASTIQFDPLLLPTRNGPCRKDGAPRWEYLS
jgi:hypothetical protein